MEFTENLLNYNRAVQECATPTYPPTRVQNVYSQAFPRAESKAD